MDKSALVIDGRDAVFRSVRDRLAPLGWHAESAPTTARALELLHARSWPVVFFSRALRAGPSLPVERELERLQPEAHLFLLTGERTGEQISDLIESPVRAVFRVLSLGADGLPVNPDGLREWVPEVEGRIEELRDAVVLPVGTPGGSPIVGDSQAMCEVRRQVAALGRTTEPALVTGEPGTGKMLVAHTIHALRHGTGEPPTLVMCEEENESFAGGSSVLADVLRTDRGGAIYVTQLERASAEVQAALLDLISASASVVAGSFRDLRELVDAGRFSADLYRGLKNYIRLPPLRERREDLPPLVSHFARGCVGKPSVRFSRRAWKLLAEYDWPFNLPELRHAVRGCLSSGGGAVCLADVPLDVRGAVGRRDDGGL